MLPAYRAFEHPPGDSTPITLIGYWSAEYSPRWPSVTDFVDEQWDEDERELVAMYLEHGLVIPHAFLQRGFSKCRFCGAVNGSMDLTDHVYQWPEGLAHYVREHGVRLPDSVVHHILNWVFRDVFDVNMDWWKAATLDS